MAVVQLIIQITRKTTCNFSQPENFVVLECITRLMDKGYRPEHIELEKEWTLGHSDKGGFADILVKDADGKTLFIVECKTAGNEYKKEFNNTLNDGGQLFSYWKQEGACKWLSLYASDFDGTNVSYTTETIDCSDDANILATAKKDPSILLYRDAGTTEDLFTAWDETYDKRLCGDVIFRDDSQAYQIGVKPLRKVDLNDFSENDKVVNKFEEILRHNNVSDKENAFNRLIALFICKLVDEIQKGDNDIVDFQYKVGTDTYETLQDRLQRLHKEGMEKFMREEIFYVADDYAENLVQQYTGQKRQKMIEDLRNTLRVLKFYTNNDFAFKDVHNEELFYQNGKILVEVVQLFENYRIIGSNDVQMLGDLFEQLLNKGFKQNEGQFFTPIPITRFIWDSLPVERIIKKADGIEFPKIIDYACGAGHFLTQGFEAVNAGVLAIDPTYHIDSRWTEHKIYGIEKDYRLARVSKISLFMHGAGNGNIIFGDGLENYTLYSLANKAFTVSLGNRVVADEQLVENGTIPVYSANVFEPFGFIDKNNITDFSCDSVIWGIDGDWMVNVIKANNPFYPTDHCGVLRINNADIIPEYLALALEKEGKYERFSRSNRASVQRIRALELLIPDKKKQNDLLKKIEQIDISLKKQRDIIAQCKREIKDKFSELFGNIVTLEGADTITKIGDIATVTKLAGFEYTNYIHYKNSGDIIMIRGLNCKGTRLVLDDIYWIDKETSDMLPRSQLHKGDVLMTYVGTVGEIALIDEDNKYHLAPNVAKITINDDKNNSATFLAYLLYYMRERIVNDMQSSALSMSKIRDIEIGLPSKEKQFEFERFVDSLADTRNKAEQELSALTNQRNKFIDKEIE